MIPAGVSLAYMFYGPCTYFGASMCYKAFTVLFHSYAHAFTLLPVSFAYRYYVLYHEPPRKRTLALLILVVYTPSAFLLVNIFFVQSL